MTTIFEELYYGNICPCTKSIVPGSKFDVTLKRLVAIEKELHRQLNEEQGRLFERFKECKRDLSCITETQVFTSGFRLGAKIILETFMDDDSVQ